jgi:short-subunit dehydrogenase
MNKTALITGASAGLGAEYAWLFAEDGHDVVLLARRKDKLDALAEQIAARHPSVRAHVLQEDLGDARAPERIVKELASRGIEIEFLVNNAGFGTTGTFAELDPARELEMLAVNVTALTHLTRLLVPAMIARKSGRVLNIGSTAGFQPGPFMAVYYASKAYVNSFTEALSVELQGTGVAATVSCPGPTTTEFAQIAGNDKSRLFQQVAMGARDVARHGYQAMLRGETMAIPGFKNKMLLQSLRIAPRRVVRGVTAGLNKVGPVPLGDTPKPPGGTS